MISIETSLAPGPWPIAGDGNQVQHLLVNLAGNARDAMPQGSTTGGVAALVWALMAAG